MAAQGQKPSDMLKDDDAEERYRRVGLDWAEHRDVWIKNLTALSPRVVGAKGDAPPEADREAMGMATEGMLLALREATTPRVAVERLELHANWLHLRMTQNEISPLGKHMVFKEHLSAHQAKAGAEEFEAEAKRREAQLAQIEAGKGAGAAPSAEDRAQAKKDRLKWLEQRNQDWLANGAWVAAKAVSLAWVAELPAMARAGWESLAATLGPRTEASQQKAMGEFCEKFGFSSISAMDSKYAGGPSGQMRDLAKVGRDIESACKKLGIDPKEFGLGARFHLEAAWEAQNNRHGGVVWAAGTPHATMGLTPKGGAATAAHEWTHLLDGMLYQKAMVLAEAAAAGADDPGLDLAVKAGRTKGAAFSHLPQRVKSFLPEAERGFQMMHAAGQGVVGEMAFDELEREQRGRMAAAARQVADRLLGPATGPGAVDDFSAGDFESRRDKLAGKCWLWVMAAAHDGTVARAGEDQGVADSKNRGFALIQKELEAIGAPRSAAAVGGVLSEVKGDPLIAMVASTIDGSKSMAAPLRAPGASRFADEARELEKKWMPATGRAYWTEPTEMLARMVGTKDRLRDKIGLLKLRKEMGGARLNWAEREQMAEGFSRLAAEAGIKGVKLGDWRDKAASAVESARKMSPPEMAQAALGALSAKLASRRAAAAGPRGAPSAGGPKL